ncbi:MAG: caspase family protein [Candidatus Latescibacterota bacterium]|nr:MAG: caspase family protein [Candidatus Latescibacterota bacterium]
MKGSAAAGSARRFSSLWLLSIAVWILTHGVTDVWSETRRALLVGIDEYEVAEPTSQEREWINLSGAVNDVEAIYSILVGRHAFKREHVRVLRNSEATREAILRSFIECLIDSASAGDVCVFYYAGHGSQVKNSNSPEPDKMDESIVPADANRGAQDIRDKELKRMFNDVLDKGAILTAFLDACHSTSMQRGLPNFARSRSLRPSNTDIAAIVGQETEDPRGDPADRGALVFAAAHESESALEVRDGQDIAHGGFSLALTKRLRTVSLQEPAQRIFLSVKAQMRAMSLWQEPTLSGTDERRSRSIFGTAASDEIGGTVVAVLSKRSTGDCVLDGGFAVGLHAGCELRWLGNVGDRLPGGTVRVQVRTVDSPVQCRARVIEGDPKLVQPGDLFELDRWSHADEAYLRVWIPQTTTAYSAVVETAQELSNLRKSDMLRWIEDPTEETPTHVVRWVDSAWVLTTPEGNVDLGPNPSAESVREILSPNVETSFFLQLPPPRELVAGLALGPAGTTGAIEVTPDPARAHYLLVGRGAGPELQYAWILPNVTRSQAQQCSPLAVRSEWCSASYASASVEQAAHRLRELAIRLAVIRGWLELEAPPDDGLFPYRLTLKSADSDASPDLEPMDSTPTAFEGQSFQVVLQADADALSQGLQQRYVYVFALDSAGRSVLLFPRNRSNADNLVPRSGMTSDPVEEIPLLGTQFTISAPFGIDTFLLLSTRQPIPDPGVLEGGRVTRGSATALSRLLSQVATGTRGITPATQMDWSIQRLSIRTVPASGD